MNKRVAKMVYQQAYTQNCE